MRTTEHPAKTPPAKTGFFATLFRPFRSGGSGAPLAGGLSLTALCTCLAIMALSATAAQAAITHQYLCQITGAGSASNSPTECDKSAPGAPGGSLPEPHSMTVDSGELFLAAGHAAEYGLDKFNASSGAFLSQFSQVPSLSFLYQGVAVGHATGEAEVYVGGDAAGTHEGAVAVFNAAGNFQAVWKGTDTPSGAFGCFECNGAGDVAADNSGLTWAAGDVYVADPENAAVDVFKPKAGGGEEYVTQLTGTEPGSPFLRPIGVAVDQSSGDVLVIDGEGRFGDVVDVFEPTAPGEYTLVRQLSATPAGPFERVTDVAVDGGNGDIYVVEGEHRARVYQFSSTGEYLTRLTGTQAGPFTDTESVAVDPATHHLYIGDYNPEAGTGTVDVFGPSVVAPDVETEPASALAPHEATLNGTVNPDGEGKATCKFEWGTSTEFGQPPVPCSEPVADGSAAVPVHASLTELQPDTTYYYRLQATNENGTNPGEPFQDREFTTPGPGIHSTSVSNVKSTSATLEATIDPHNAPTTYYFQYGPSVAYGEKAPLTGIRSPWRPDRLRRRRRRSQPARAAGPRGGHRLSL